MERQFFTKHFIHHVDQFGKRLFTVTYDLKIPLPSQNCAPADLFGHLLAQNDLPPPFLMEVRAKFEKFVRDETRKFDAELAARRIENALAMSADENMGDAFVALATNCNVDDVVANCDANHHGMPLASPGNTYKAEPLFEEQFQHVMRNASMNKLSLLLAEESRMTEELRALVRARNFEVERIKRICEQTIVQSVADATVNEFDKHSYEISMHNEKLRQVSSNYSHQIEALNERQRQEFRQLVHEMYANEKSLSSGGKKEFASLSSSFSCANALSASAQIPQPPHYSRPFQKSLSYDSKIMAQQQQQSEIGTICRQPVPISQCCSESFTIYIGAQLKTMHNARILTCDQLVDLLSMDNNENDNKSICGNFGTNDKTIIPHVDDDNVIICHSQRLQLLMNLYRRDLACAVLIVDASDPLWHVKERSKFAQLCEHSAELHFDSLERQLLKIEQDLMKANRERRSAAALRRRRQQRDCDDGKAATDEPSLPGSGASKKMGKT